MRARNSHHGVSTETVVTMYVAERGVLMVSSTPAASGAMASVPSPSAGGAASAREGGVDSRR